MTEILARHATSEEYAALARIFRRAALSNPGDRETLRAHPEYLVLSPDLIGRGRTRVATLPDGTIIGFASTSRNGNDTLELDDLFVDPDWRRHGAARRLIDRIVHEARDENVARIEVTANEHALEFYNAAGFINDGTTGATVGWGYRMHLDVPTSPFHTGHGG
jgi:GNAT superfamily N-acetyltransferase